MLYTYISDSDEGRARQNVVSWMNDLSVDR